MKLEETVVQDLLV